MDSVKAKPTTVCHVVALPYPGRGHVNPMMNLCKLLVSKMDDILITFVFTEEWLGFVGSEPKPDNIRFATIPNVVPSELDRADDILGFYDAVMTKMEAPFEQLLDKLEPPATIILADTFLYWAVRVGNRRNIPVASFWTMATSVFSVFHHFDLFAQNGHFPVDLQEKGDIRADYIPGMSSTRLADLPVIINNARYQKLVLWVLKAFLWVQKAQHVLFTSIYELESHVIDALKPQFSCPLYAIGPAIPYFKARDSCHNDHDYLQWLDGQSNSSVLYVSLGSFLSVSSAQMDEIAAGLRDSSVRYLWVAREEAGRLKGASGDMGFVVPWCDQLKVLSHSSVGGFWSHCGWNSVREGVFAGVPFLTFPIFMDQTTDSKLIVEDWKIGWRVKSHVGGEKLVLREEIALIVRKFMDLESSEVKEMKRKARQIQEMCQCAVAEGGSSESNINLFINDISKCCTN